MALIQTVRPNFIAIHSGKEARSVGVGALAPALEKSDSEHQLKLFRYTKAWLHLTLGFQTQ